MLLVCLRTRLAERFGKYFARRRYIRRGRNWFGRNPWKRRRRGMRRNRRAIGSGGPDFSYAVFQRRQPLLDRSDGAAQIIGGVRVGFIRHYRRLAWRAESSLADEFASRSSESHITS